MDWPQLGAVFHLEKMTRFNTGLKTHVTDTTRTGSRLDQV